MQELLHTTTTKVNSLVYKTEIKSFSKVLFGLMLTSFFVFSFFQGKLEAKGLDVTVAAESAILMNADTAAILYEKKSHQKQFPASITKVATALYALKIKGDELETMVSAEAESIASLSESAIRRANYKYPAYYIEQGSCHMGIKKGEELKFKDLLYGMMLPSANDAANVVAQFTSGTIPLFIEELNDFVKTLGCQNTCFKNPHGLHHPDHMTTAFDMALIIKEALKDPIFCEIVKSVRYTRPKTNKQESTTLIQLNKLLRNGKYYYDKAIGVKTGKISVAQNTFIAAAREGDRTLILVLLKTKERNDIFEDSIKVFEVAFNEQKVKKVLVTKGKQKFVFASDKGSKPVETYALRDLTIDYYPSEEPILKSFLKWEELTFPIVKGQKVGEIVIRNDTAKSFKTIDLFAEEDVPSSWGHWFRSFFS